MVLSLFGDEHVWAFLLPCISLNTCTLLFHYNRSGTTVIFCSLISSLVYYYSISNLFLLISISVCVVNESFYSSKTKPVAYNTKGRTNVLKTGPVSELEKGLDGRVTISTVVELELIRDVIIMYYKYISSIKPIT